MKRFSMIIGLIFFIGVFTNGCDKGEQPPEPNVKDAAKTEMEEPAEALEEVKEKAEEVLEETAQDVKEAAETVKEEAVESMEEAMTIFTKHDYVRCLFFALSLVAVMMNFQRHISFPAYLAFIISTL